jgi:hypothetical protein
MLIHCSQSVFLFPGWSIGMHTNFDRCAVIDIMYKDILGSLLIITKRLANIMFFSYFMFLHIDKLVDCLFIVIKINFQTCFNSSFNSLNINSLSFFKKTKFSLVVKQHLQPKSWLTKIGWWYEFAHIRVFKLYIIHFWEFFFYFSTDMVFYKCFKDIFL